MKYTEKNIEGISVFELEGKLMGGSDCDDLFDRMMDVIATSQSNLIVDFAKVQLVNSAGIGALMQCLTRLRRGGGDLHFVGVHDEVGYYFRITRLDNVLKIYNSIDEVLSQLSPSLGFEHFEFQVLLKKKISTNNLTKVLTTLNRLHTNVTSNQIEIKTLEIGLPESIPEDSPVWDIE